MRPGQNKRMRGRNRRGPNPLTRSFESNGPDVKVRGTAQHVAEKYTQLARDAHVAGDPVAAESYLQHAEHYYRIIAAAHQAQQMLQNGTLDDRDDLDDDDFDTTNDRFTFRAPQAANQQGNGQPYPGDRGQSEFGEGGEERLEGEDAAPQERPAERQHENRNGQRNHRDDRRNNRGQDRNFRPRNEGNSDRNFQERNNSDRGFNPREAQNRDNSGKDLPERNQERHERGNGERFVPNAPRPRRPQPEIDGYGEQPILPALPAFLTAPTRTVPVEANAPTEAGPEEGAESGRSQFRTRRRRRSRPGQEEAPETAAEIETSGSEPV